MPPSKSRFVTVCQQLLALGVVLAGLTPAASVVSLDVVRDAPGAASTAGARGAGPTGDVAADLAAYTRSSARPATVPTQVVDPTVDEFALTAPAVSGAARGKAGALGSTDRLPAVHSRTKAGVLGGEEVTSVPEPVVGYGAVGVTWEHGTRLPADDLRLSVRTRTGDTWTGWMDLEYDPEHGPDPGSAEARQARPGTDALLVGDVDQVQVRAAATSALPTDLRLAVVDPGQAQRTAVEKPAIDTTSLDGSEAPTAPPAGSTSGSTAATTAATTAAAGAPASLATDPGQGTGGSDRIALQAAVYTPKPQIFSRAQWGADERMRDKSSLHYGEVHAGFVHHTVNANDYTRAEVPGILRSIYAYHTQSRGWSDIGYNFLVDRFGRIWEGRYGGIDRPVVGAHTLNYNDWSFAMSAIGNYDVKQPSQAMVQAYGALFAWKLSLHGVDASSTRQWVGSRYFQAINGHRDAASTACPGRYLYAKIPEIRTLAAEAQRGWAGRELESDLAGSPYPDLVVRRSSDKQAFVIPTGGLTSFRKGVRAASGLTDDQDVVVSPDLTGDGYGDLLVRSADGSTALRPGDGRGRFGPSTRTMTAFAGHDLLTAIGDIDGDGRNDLAARATAAHRLDLYLGRGDGTFRVRQLGTGWGYATRLIGPGDANGDGVADLLSVDSSGTLWLNAGTRAGAFSRKVTVPGSWSRFSGITGYGDFNRDGRTDLFVRDSRTGNGYVAPSDGDGTYGHLLGPIQRTAPLRSLVGAAQLVGDGTPDLVGRTGSGLVTYPNTGRTETGAPIATGVRLGGADLLLNAGDWDRDGRGDIITRTASTGALYLRRGDGAGHFGPPTRIGTGFGGVQLLAAVGDATGDGWPDLMGQPRSGDIRIYPGNGLRGFKPSYVAHSRIDAGQQVAVGRWDTDGAPDSLFRKGSGVTLFPGNGPGGLTDPKALRTNLTRYDWVVGVSDVLLTGHSDVIVRERATGNLYVIQGRATGFTPRRFLASGMGGYDLAG